MASSNLIATVSTLVAKAPNLKLVKGSWNGIVAPHPVRFRQKPVAWWLEELEKASVGCSSIQNLEELQFNSNDLLWFLFLEPVVLYSYMFLLLLTCTCGWCFSLRIWTRKAFNIVFSFDRLALRFHHHVIIASLTFKVAQSGLCLRTLAEFAFEMSQFRCWWSLNVVSQLTGDEMVCAIEHRHGHHCLQNRFPFQGGCFHCHFHDHHTLFIHLVWLYRNT